MKKIGALVPIRLDSERLPMKALKMLCGRPVVTHLLDRIEACRNINSAKDIVVCTTKEKTDDPLVEIVESYGASIFRGEKNDLIQRFKDTVDKFNFDIILQVDGDDPLSETEYMDLTIEALLKDQSIDTSASVGLPFGVNVKSFTRTALEKVISCYRSKHNDTGFALYFTKSTICQCKEIPPLNKAHILNNARLTLDYEEDLTVFKKIFDALYKPKKVFHLSEVLTFLRSNPDIIKINNALQNINVDRSRKKLNIAYQDEYGCIQQINL